MFAALMAGAVAFTLIEWIAVAAALVLLVVSIAVYSNEHYGVSFVTMVAMFVSIGVFAHVPVFDLIRQPSAIAHAVLLPIVVYLLIGVVVSFANWVLYCMHVKTRYRNLVLPYLMDSEKFANYRANILKQMNDQRKVQFADTDLTDDFVRQVLQLDLATSNKQTIFGYAYKVNTSFDTWTLRQYEMIEDMQAMIAKKMAELFPPRTLQGKTILASAVFEWPITILSTLFSRVLTVLVDKVIFVSRKFIDWVSRISFGSHEIKI
jgi:hypothetical protein